MLGTFTGNHIPPTVLKDYRKIVSELEDVDIFTHKKRSFNSFSFKTGLISNINRDSAAEYILQKALQFGIQL